MKFIKKVFKILVIIILIAFSTSSIYYNYWRNKNTIPAFNMVSKNRKIDYSTIYWRDGNIGEISIKKTAFFIKVKVNNSNNNYYMQLDTGTPSTVFYEKTLNQLGNQINIKTLFKKDSIEYVVNPIIQIGNTSFSAKKIKILKNMGANKMDSLFTVIGTIGFDILVDRTLILNFKKNKLAITNKSLKEIDSTINLIKNASVDRFPILIPAKLNQKKIRLFYDSGSSLFSVLTSYKNLSLLKNNNKIDTLCCVQNWDSQLQVYRKKLKHQIQIGNIKESTKNIYAIDKMQIVNYFPNWFIYGITGNKVFDNKIIIIDNKNNLLGIKN